MLSRTKSSEHRRLAEVLLGYSLESGSWSANAGRCVCPCSTSRRRGIGHDAQVQIWPAVKIECALTGARQLHHEQMLALMIAGDRSPAAALAELLRLHENRIPVSLVTDPNANPTGNDEPIVPRSRAELRRATRHAVSLRPPAAPPDDPLFLSGEDLEDELRWLKSRTPAAMEYRSANGPVDFGQFSPRDFQHRILQCEALLTRRWAGVAEGSENDASPLAKGKRDSLLASALTMDGGEQDYRSHLDHEGIHERGEHIALPHAQSGATAGHSR